MWTQFFFTTQIYISCAVFVCTVIPSPLSLLHDSLVIRQRERVEEVEEEEEEKEEEEEASLPHVLSSRVR